MEEEMIAEEQMPEEQMPEQGAPVETVPVEEGQGEYEGEIPQGMQDEIVEGALALFHTAIQVFNSNGAKERVKRWLRAGNLTEAAFFAVMESVKNHKKNEIPVTPPMMIGAAPYITTFAQTLSNKMGQDVTKATAKKCSLEVIDRIIGLYQGGKLADQHKEQAAAMRRQEEQQAQQSAPPPEAGMMPPGGGAPAGGLM